MYSLKWCSPRCTDTNPAASARTADSTIVRYRSIGVGLRPVTGSVTRSPRVNSPMSTSRP